MMATVDCRNLLTQSRQDYALFTRLEHLPVEGILDSAAHKVTMGTNKRNPTQVLRTVEATMCVPRGRQQLGIHILDTSHHRKTIKQK